MGFIREEEFLALLDSFKRVEGRDWGPLFGIMEKCVRPIVYNWYAVLDDHLKTVAKTEEDFFMDLCMEMMYKVEGSLLKHEGQEIPARAAQLHGWLDTVARNELKEEKKRLKREYEYMEKMKKTGEGAEERYDSEMMDEYHKKINASFRLVINSRINMHKILFWLNLSLYTFAIVGSRAAIKKQVTPILSKMKLAKMYETVKNASEKLKWMKLTQEDMDKIENALAQPYGDSVYGEAVLSEFYGNRDATTATSDWVNKIDKMVERSIGEWLI